MSRSNPFKKKRREAKKTMLIYGEGQAEEIFLKHLRSLFSYKNDLSITIKKGKGGTPEEIVKSAINYLGFFNKKIVIVDNDKNKIEMEKARKKAQEHSIELIENTPCLEAMLLSILESKNFNSKSSAWCKREFEKKYIAKKQRAEPHRYEELFSKITLERQMKTVSILNQLITIMQGI